VKYDIGPKAKNCPSTLGAPNSTSLGHVITYIFLLEKKNHTTKSTRPLGVKGVGTDLNLFANHKRRFQASYTTNQPSL
jgi:hypothetical protein